jgi:hypothetical protein
MTQPVIDRGEFRRISQFAVPWPAFVILARKSTVRRYGEELYQLLSVVTKTAKKLERDPQTASLISTRYRLRLSEARQCLANTRWKRGFEMPKGAIQRIIASLRQVDLIASKTVRPSEIWHDLRVHAS